MLFLLIYRVVSESFQYTTFSTSFNKLYTNIQGDYFFSNCIFQDILTYDNSPLWFFGGTNTKLLELFRCTFHHCTANQGGSLSITDSKNSNYNFRARFLCVSNCQASQQGGLWFFRFPNTQNFDYITTHMCSSPIRTALWIDGSGPMINNWNATFLKATYEGDSMRTEGAFYTHCSQDYRIQYTSIKNCTSRDSLFHSWWSEGNLNMEKVDFIENDCLWYAVIFLNNSHTAKIYLKSCLFKRNRVQRNIFKCETGNGDAAQIVLVDAVASDKSVDYKEGNVDGTIMTVHGDYSTKEFTFFETQRCMNQNIPYPERTPLKTAVQTPRITPLITPRNTPYMTAHKTPVNTERETPAYTAKETPYFTNHVTPFITNKETPYLTEKETPHVTNAETPSFTAFDTPYLTEEETPYLTAFDTPHSTNEETPYLTEEETPLLTPLETPYLTEEETPYLTAFDTPHSTNEETPYLTEEETPLLTPLETPYLTEHETPFETAFETPFLTNEETPFITEGETAFETPFITNAETAYETPFISNFETPVNTPVVTAHDTPFQTNFETFYETPHLTNEETPMITSFETNHETPYITFET
ncbi:bifunctional inhibitor/lipid-transfer protein/seed storage 2s albumin superfamily protein family, partial [Trichomonas vaginalis G3]|uniref:bifunctional inhibitor/lipid-transfer protein/seed storage 2s albumin superfamily protein family n=1 Tax=Trichomonas vaginalis (strain ATCC PRA-98 / G3) TaxID=412133 RepID=UPI0021E5E2D4